MWQVLTAASEKDKPEEGAAPLQGLRAVEKDYVVSGSWHKASKVDMPTVTTTLKNLVTLYRKQGRAEAADQLDNCAVKIKKDVSWHLHFMAFLACYLFLRGYEL